MFQPLSKPVALFPSHHELMDIQLYLYPDLSEFLKQSPSWFNQNWQWASEFLLYIGRNKSEHTFTRFRNEVERFLLWSYLYRQKPVEEFRKSDVLAYVDFCVKPPVDWIASAPYDRFEFVNNRFEQNKSWRPFMMRVAKASDSLEVNKKKYRPSQQTIASYFVSLGSFYNHLIDADLCMGNPVPKAKKDCRHLQTSVQVKTFERLTDEQWVFVVDSAESLASSNPKFERNLFIVVTMKALFLRISELSERKMTVFDPIDSSLLGKDTIWMPLMNHFWCDHEGNWWFKVLGKGQKIRDITVPDSYLSYLQRYRIYRGLSPLPSKSDQALLLNKLKGDGGLTTRQLSRLVQEVFDVAYQNMKDIKGENQASKLKEATTHYLRHTGASQEIERGRALKDTSEDLGHSSMATTDTIYAQTELRKRAESGKNRKI